MIIDVFILIICSDRTWHVCVSPVKRPCASIAIKTDACVFFFCENSPTSRPVWCSELTSTEKLSSKANLCLRCTVSELTKLTPSDLFRGSRIGYLCMSCMLIYGSLVITLTAFLLQTYVNLKQYDNNLYANVEDLTAE